MHDLLLDTHIWIWYAEGTPGILSPVIQGQIERARKQRCLYVSVVSAWEIGLLIAKGRIVLSAPLQEWVKAGAALVGESGGGIARATGACVDHRSRN